MLKGQLIQEITARPVVFLLTVFLLIVGFAAGIVTHTTVIDVENTPLYLINTPSNALVLSCSISLIKSVISICSCILCAIWLPGILIHFSTTLIKGFIIGFTLCALIRCSPLQGILFSVIGIIIPECAIGYGYITISLISVGEWRLRLKSYFTDRTVSKVSDGYFISLRSGLRSIALGVFIEGILSPLIIRLL